MPSRTLGEAIRAARKRLWVVMVSVDKRGNYSACCCPLRGATHIVTKRTEPALIAWLDSLGKEAPDA